MCPSAKVLVTHRQILSGPKIFKFCSQVNKHLLFLSFNNTGIGKLFGDQNTEVFVLIWVAMHAENCFLYFYFSG